MAIRQVDRNHAVVIGASMAGLLTTRVLSDHFQHVTLIERDYLPELPENRQGVPQDRQPHTLLIRGEQIITRFFPELPADLIQAGAVRIDLADNVLWFQEGGYKIRFDSGIAPLCMSRPLLESCIRRRVLAVRNVTCLQGCNVSNIVGSEDGRYVTGVQIRQRTAGSPEKLLNADLVVDATGRGSKSPKWLEMLGYSRPDESIVKVDVSYTTRLYQRDPALLTDAKGILIMAASPHGKRGGGLFPIEGNQWLVTLTGWLGNRAPTDEQGFLDYAKSLPDQKIYNVISQAEPLTQAVTYRLPSNLRRHYERMAHFPEGYLVIGDAICSFNPVYGQGMSVSALEVEALDRCLRKAARRNNLHGLAQDFFRSAAQTIENPWMMAVCEDFRFPGVQGPMPVGTHLINWYTSQLHKMMMHDCDVTRAFFQVITLTSSPKVLFSPKIMLRVLGNL